MIDRRAMIGAAVGVPVATQVAPLMGNPPAWPPAERFTLWPGPPPGSPATLPTPSADGLSLRGIATPYVGVFRPDQPDGRAVLAIPGGGYGFVSVGNEGLDVARTLTPLGITVFVLVYRLPGDGWADRADVPLQDAQRAMRLIRADAGRHGVNPAGLAVLGFSAGGHLAASLTVGHDDRVYAPVDAADRQSARPVATGLVYPVTSLATPTTHKGSTDQLLGPNPAPMVIARYNTPQRLTAEAPPLFLVHAMDDAGVPVDQTLELLAAARAVKVPVETHLFDRGGHGFGALSSPPAAPRHHWPAMFDRWLRERFAIST